MWKRSRPSVSKRCMHLAVRRPRRMRPRCLTRLCTSWITKRCVPWWTHVNHGGRRHERVQLERAIGLAVLVVSVLHWMGCEQPATHPLPKGNVKGLVPLPNEVEWIQSEAGGKGMRCDGTLTLAWLEGWNLSGHPMVGQGRHPLETGNGRTGRLGLVHGWRRPGTRRLCVDGGARPGNHRGPWREGLSGAGRRSGKSCHPFARTIAQQVSPCLHCGLRTMPSCATEGCFWTVAGTSWSPLSSRNSSRSWRCKK